MTKQQKERRKVAAEQVAALMAAYDRALDPENRIDTSDLTSEQFAELVAAIRSAEDKR